MELYLIRHGETDFVKSGGTWGQKNDEPLNEEGILQAKHLSERLKRISFDKIYSSDLKRAKQTAEIVGRGQRIFYDKRLREYQPGSVDPNSEEWTEEYKRLLSKGIPKEEIRPFGGDNIWGIIKNAESFLKDLEKEEGKILVISHSGFNSILMNISQGRKKDDFIEFKQENTCVNILVFEGREWKIKVINDSSHLPKKRDALRLYEDQEKIKNFVVDAIREKYEKYFSDWSLSGDLEEGAFSYYEKPYKKLHGSHIEIIGNLKEGITIPKNWKISKMASSFEEYDIGKIEIEGRYHRVVLKIENLSQVKKNIKKKLIIFDLDDTLFHSKESYKYIFSEIIEEKWGIKKDISVDAFTKTEEEINIDNYSTIKDYYDNFNNKFLSKILINVTNEKTKSFGEILKLVKKIAPIRLKTHDFALETLQELKKRGYYISILTGTREKEIKCFEDSEYATEKRKIIEKLLEHSKLNKFIDRLFIAYEYSTVKPDPKAFQVVLDYFKVSPEEAIMIGDKESDILASQLGITSVLFDPNEEYSGKTLPDKRIKSFKEILEFL